VVDVTCKQGLAGKHPREEWSMPYRPAGGSLRVLPARPVPDSRAKKVRGGIIAVLIGLLKAEPFRLTGGR